MDHSLIPGMSFASGSASLLEQGETAAAAAADRGARS